MRSSTPKDRFARTTHYAIPPLAHGNNDEILNLIRDKRYFVLHAPERGARRDCGKQRRERRRD